MRRRTTGSPSKEGGVGGGDSVDRGLPVGAELGDQINHRGLATLLHLAGVVAVHAGPRLTGATGVAGLSRGLRRWRLGGALEQARISPLDRGEMRDEVAHRPTLFVGAALELLGLQRAQERGD